MYVKIDHKIIGGVNIDQLQDPNYLEVNWKDNSDSFLVVHRLGVREEYWDNGIGKFLMEFKKI